MKKIIFLFLAAVILFSGCSKNSGNPAVKVDNPKTETNQQQNSISLFYNKEEEISPIASTSIENRAIVGLVYDSLFTVGDDFSVTPSLASSYTQSGKVLTINLRDDVNFTNGKEFSSEDVIYTFTQLQQSIYKDVLSKIETVNAVNSRQVEVVLFEENSRFVSNLTFPILSADGVQNNGTGRYVLQEDTLILKQSHFKQEENNIKTIKLFADENKIDLFNKGQLTFLFEEGKLSISEIDRLSVAARYSTNKLTYLGINTNKKILSNSLVRIGLSAAIDRNVLAGFVDGGCCYTTYSPINPKWFMSDNSIETVRENPETLFDNGGYKKDENNHRFTLNLIVNNGNFSRNSVAKQIAVQLSKYGITVNVSTLPWEQYKRAIARGDYDLYIAQTDLGNDMSVSKLFKTDSELYNLGTALTNENIGQFETLFNSETPLIPLYFDEVRLLTQPGAQIEQYGLIMGLLYNK